MQTVEIKINPYKQINQFSFADRGVSIYNSLNKYVNVPFELWVDKCFSIIENDINDVFNIELISEDYEYLIFELLRMKSDSCVEIIRKPFRNKMTSLERKTKLLELHKTLFDDDYISRKVGVYNDTDSLNSYNTNCNKSDADIYITRNKENVDYSNCLSIILDDADDIKISNDGHICVWCRESMAEKLLEAFVSKREETEEVKNLYDVLKNDENCDKSILDLYTEIDEIVSIPDIPLIKLDRPFIWLDSTLDLSQFRFEVDDESVVSVENGIIHPHKSGNTRVKVYRGKSLTPIATKNVEVDRQHYYISSIDLAVDNPVMSIDSSQVLRVGFYPEESEDANELTLQISDPSVITYRNGKIVALKDGICRLTVKTERVSKSIEISVRADIEEIIFDKYEVNMIVGTSEELRYRLYPENVYNNNVQWISSDTRVADVSYVYSGLMDIKGKGIGTCIISCVAEKGNCVQRCKVIVGTSFRRRKSLF